jgi:putative membrane protein
MAAVQRIFALARLSFDGIRPRHHHCVPRRGAFMFASLPLYLMFLGTAVGLLISALALYVLITPHHEIRLIRQGNTAAAYSLGGTAIGMAIVIHGTASSTYVWTELLAWGAVGLVGQLFVYGVVTLMIPGLKQGLTDDKTSYGILLGALSIAMGILNAGALSS